MYSVIQCMCITFYNGFGYLHAEAYETAQFVQIMNQLFDLLSSSDPFPPKKYNVAFKGEPFQSDCWTLFIKLEVRDKNNVNITKKIKILKFQKIIL